jgi:hypothetical protein
LLPAVVRLAEELMTRHQFRVDIVTAPPDPAKDPATCWLVPVGDAEDPELYAVLTRRQQAGGVVVLISAGPLAGPWAGWTGPVATAPDTAALLPLLPAAALADPDSGPGIVLVHDGPDGRPVVVFAFNPGEHPTTLRRRIHGTTLALPLPPGGAALLDGSLEPVLALPGPDDTTWTPPTSSRPQPTSKETLR